MFLKKYLTAIVCGMLLAAGVQASPEAAPMPRVKQPTAFALQKGVSSADGLDLVFGGEFARAADRKCRLRIEICSESGEHLRDLYDGPLQSRPFHLSEELIARCYGAARSTVCIKYVIYDGDDKRPLIEPRVHTLTRKLKPKMRPPLLPADLSD